MVKDNWFESSLISKETLRADIVEAITLSSRQTHFNALNSVLSRVRWILVNMENCSSLLE